MIQFEMLPGDRLSPEDIVALALEEEGPVLRSFCLISGGHDSTVLAHRCRDLYDELAFIDTGTALPGVRDFVEWFCRDYLAKPLRVLDAGAAYRTMVLGSDAWWRWFEREWPRIADHDRSLVAAIRYQQRERGRERGNMPQGFPGPAGGHRVAYSRLKERQLETLVRDTKAAHGGGRFARVLLLSGARHHESRRRMVTQDVAFRRRGAQLWVNGLHDWRNDEMRAYRAEHSLPESDVAALLHRSGECNCGSYAGPNERQDLRALYPDWWARVIAPLEEEAQRRGIPRSRWGESARSGRPGARGIADLEPGPLCSDCQLRLA